MGQDLSAMRAIAARIKMRCAYCNVPTAATIEHVQPRAQGGTTWMHNLVLACPYCNTKKSTRDVDEFKLSGDWKLTHPPMPESMQEMLKEFFGWDRGEGEVWTGSAHARLEVGDEIAILIRPGADYQWTRMVLGDPENPGVIAASYDFLKRHYTPLKPKPVPARYWKKD